MKIRNVAVYLMILGFCGGLFADPYNVQRAKAEKLFNDGNYKEAHEQYRGFLGKADIDQTKISRDLNLAGLSLHQLGRDAEQDAFYEEMVEVHSDSWRALDRLAHLYISAQKQGFIVAGEFNRGHHRGGGKQAHVYERDRTRALQLMQLAEKLVRTEAKKQEAAMFYWSYGKMMASWRNYGGAWRLQYLTDLATLPEVEAGYYYGYGYNQNKGAPVDADGHPVFHHLPDSWEAAKSDGERWRWLMNKSVEVHPANASMLKREMADFHHNQFGVQTMAHYGHFFSRMAGDEEASSSTFSLPGLKETETIARLASGIKRFALPDEFNFIKLYREVNADYALGSLFQNRLQYPKAAEHFENAGNEERVNQIVKNWGQFQQTPSQLAKPGGSKVGYRFRNGKRVELTAYEIEVEDLLSDLEKYLKSKPKQLDWNKMNLNAIGYRIIQQNQKKYLGRKAASWKVNLKPRAAHFDRTIMIDVPLKKPGAYMLTAKMSGGNESNMVLWLNDTVIVKKNLATNVEKGPGYYFVADAATGAPVAGAKVDFFGYWQEYMKPKIGRAYQKISTIEFTVTSDALGQVIPTSAEAIPNKRHSPQYLVTARSKGGRLAFLGMTQMWFHQRHDQQYHQTKTFLISDRPVYRPNQTAQFKGWTRKAQYDMGEVSTFASKNISFTLYNPKNEKVFSKSVKADEYGGAEVDWAIPDDAPLGVYRLQSNNGTLTFRVEEYKKPEFEVTIEAPDEPVKLGDLVTAEIHAKYLFGAPVVNAKVKYKVSRSAHDARWYPYAPWDWMYGKGYWWFGYDYQWYPGWGRWGCMAPYPWWWNRSNEPPEIVLENEVEIGADGIVKFQIDTRLAKAVHGDTDHRYQITAEVTDESRRTIVGQGSVTVAREPFKVYAWVDRGFYQSGEVLHASFNAQTVDGKPVQGKGEVTLYLVKYNQDGEPIEKAVESWDLDTDTQGRAQLQFKTTRPGQYRLSYKVTDSEDHEIEGGYVFVVRGQKLKGEDARFNDLELILDKKEYAPGDSIKLMINTDHEDSTVVLFLRPSNSTYLKPKVIRVDGKSTVELVEVVKKDMPNFFIEAFTVAGGKVFSETREVIVPPEKRVINVDVLPSAERYLPGADAKVKVKLTDLDGEPVVGATVLSVYDKAVEYISGGSNVDDIKTFFWKWRRHHYPQIEHSLSRMGRHIHQNGKQNMGVLGVFGHLADAVGDRSRRGEKKQLGRTGALRSATLDKASVAMVPAAAAAPMGNMNMLEAQEGASDDFAGAVGGGGGGFGADAGGPTVEPTVRKNFADTAFWTGSLNTDRNGLAEVSFKMPENLSGWKVKSWAMGHGTRVGEGVSEVVTAKNVLVRLQAPRFFVEKDEVVLSGNIHNYLEEKKAVKAVLELDGSCLELIDDAESVIQIDGGGEQRVDWRVRVLREGEAVVRVKALTDVESDAMEMKFPVYVHGMLKTDSYSGLLRPEQDNGEFVIKVPQERRVDETRLEIRYSPTLAGAMVDAIPYLADYPYGCTEQTLSRFLPAVMTQKVLLEMGIDLEDVKKKRTNLNAQEIGDDQQRAAQWKRYKRNPVFDRAVLDDMVATGVKRLTAMQLRDGGWGWFSGTRERSTAHTTAYVVHGLQLALENDVEIEAKVLRRGVEWLKREQAERVRWIKAKDHRRPNNLDAFVYMVLVDSEHNNKAMQDLLYEFRNGLAVYAKAMFGIALHNTKDIAKRDMLVRNIEQFLQRDDENQSAWLELNHQTYWWYWYGSEYEAHAYYLKLLNRIDPKGDKAPALVKYLLNNRKHATYWNSTRDTAICLEAFAEFLRASGENKPDYTLDVLVDGRKVKEVQIDQRNLFTFDNKVLLHGDALSSGEHTISFRKKGNGPLYYNAYLTNFSLEDYIPKAGLEVKVERKFYRLTEVDKSIKAQGARGQAVDQKVEKYERSLIADLDTLKSGDLVEIELEIDSKNDYEYLVFEDMKAAGFEPVDVRSGYNGNDMGAYVEFRDEKVAFFVRHLARGKHSVSYRVRAEIPGKFSALPTRAEAMYAPELKANSSEIKLVIED